MSFTPDYTRLEKAARNIATDIVPLYDHLIHGSIAGKIIGTKSLWDIHDEGEYDEFYRLYSKLLSDLGYDVVIQEFCTSFALVDGGALGGHKKGAIQTREDFEKYPWDEICERYFTKYAASLEAMRRNMPTGMKGVGGIGNGVFEVVQDLVGYTDLCYMSVDDPELYADMFVKVGDLMVQLWSKFMKEYGDIYCVLRFGDDLGYKSQTLLPVDDVKTHIIPQYKRIIDVVHSYNKPFLLHSCGYIFEVMDDLINVAGIDAKHSNEDAIRPFSGWVDQYGDRIGNFGGVDTDVICHDDEKMIREYVEEVYKKCVGRGGIAFGTGNSVPEYTNVNGYLAMNRAFRELRGDFK